jgi:hypothetical protein
MSRNWIPGRLRSFNPSGDGVLKFGKRLLLSLAKG